MDRYRIRTGSFIVVHLWAGFEKSSTKIVLLLEATVVAAAAKKRNICRIIFGLLILRFVCSLGLMIPILDEILMLAGPCLYLYRVSVVDAHGTSPS